MTFRIRQLKTGFWFWELVYANGRIAATSDNFYDTERLAIRSSERVINAISGDRWHIESPEFSATGWWRA